MFREICFGIIEPVDEEVSVSTITPGIYRSKVCTAFMISVREAFSTVVVIRAVEKNPFSVG